LRSTPFTPEREAAVVRVDAIVARNRQDGSGYQAKPHDPAEVDPDDDNPTLVG
jgi:hypothetical protein